MYTFLVTRHVKLCTTSKSGQQEGHHHIQVLDHRNCDKSYLIFYNAEFFTISLLQYKMNQYREVWRQARCKQPEGWAILVYKRSVAQEGEKNNTLAILPQEVCTRKQEKQKRFQLVYGVYWVFLRQPGERTWSRQAISRLTHKNIGKNQGTIEGAYTSKECVVVST